MKKVSDFIFEYLSKNNIKHVYMLSGGGIMYLVDSLGRSNIEYVCCHHEQAAAIAAQADAMYNNDTSVCLITTGPGGTNALTGAAAAYVDSTPVLFLTGQVKRADFASKRGVRQFGAQENDIVSMVKSVTKYAETILEPEDVLYHLQKALHLANHGRKGPVWLDIPLDVQSAEIDETQLTEFHPETEVLESTIEVEKNDKTVEIEEAVGKTIEMLKEAKRPLILVGHGVTASGAMKTLRKLQQTLKSPVVCTWRTLDAFDDDNPYFFGSPGLQANRYSNLITQGADFLLVLGSRLDNMITAFNEEHFAYRAKKMIVDIDEKEITKLHTTDTSYVVCNVAEYLQILVEKCKNEKFPDYTPWIGFCTDMKQTYPLLQEKQVKLGIGADLYQVSDAISKYCKKEDVLVVSSTSRCNTAGHMAFSHKADQKAISSMGMGSMGFALPSVIGAHFASGKQQIIMLEGDGSLQLNIQELQTINTYHINAKMFIWSNTGYAAISTMQERNFEGFYVGSNPESGVIMPDLSKIAAAYDLLYVRIDKNENIEENLCKVFATEGAVLCEVVGDIAFDEIPKCISNVNEQGVRVSASLENPYPFLSDEEMEQIWQKLPE